MSNLLSSIDEDHYLRMLVNNNDLRLVMSHFVNYLLHIGIICPLEDASNPDKFMVATLNFVCDFHLLIHSFYDFRWTECTDGSVQKQLAIMELLVPNKIISQFKSTCQMYNKRS
jgi:hypothetical protein